MSPLFTIIIPAYNVERYIKRCIFSIISHGNLNFSYEIIVTDDGSTDQTSSILDKLEYDISALSVIHTENEGVSHARNTALKSAKGQYIIFLDADDYFLPDWHHILYNTVEVYNEDFIFFDFIKKYDNATEKKVSYPVEGSIFEWCQKAFIVSDYMNPCWSRIYKKSIIEKYQIVFDESMISGEDFSFSLSYIQHCHTAVIIHSPFLYKEERQNSAMHQIHINQYIKNNSKILSERISYMKKIKQSQYYQDCLILHFNSITNMCLQIINNLDFNQQKKDYFNLVHCHYTTKIINELCYKKLCLRKRIEYFLLKNTNIPFIQFYFHFKIKFIKHKKEIG